MWACLDNLLYAGCRSFDADYHYRAEWEEYARKGALVAKVAASRDQVSSDPFKAKPHRTDFLPLEFHKGEQSLCPGSDTTRCRPHYGLYNYTGRERLYCWVSLVTPLF